MLFNFFKSKDMGIDLGTANTLIYVKDEGIVLNEPTVIASNSRSGEILAVGKEAKEMLGKAPDTITVVRPLQSGVISDFDKTADMLKTFIQRAVPMKKFSGFRVAVGVPSGVTEVEKRAVEEVVRNMGATEVFVLEEPMAAAIGAGLPVDGTEGCMIADIGGGTSDIAVIALGGIVASSSIRYAGDNFNEAIINYMRKRHTLHIGERTAEQLKINVGCADLDEDQFGKPIITTMKASGRDIISGLPVTLDISNKDIMIALAESVNTIVDGIKATVEKIPPEIAADVANHGLVLSGGGGQLHNLDKVITARTGMKAKIAENAYEAVVLGAGRSLDDIEKLKLYAMDKRRIGY